MTKASQAQSPKLQPTKARTAPAKPASAKPSPPPAKAVAANKSSRRQPASPIQPRAQSAGGKAVIVKPHRSQQTSKQSQLIALLSRKEGSSLSEMMATTGWQAHSVRGVLSGTLRKRLGLDITRSVTPEGMSIYRIVA